jgi:uncharacterized protein (TIGR02453 family)
VSVGADTLGGMTFQGWPAEALEFYEGLEADNSKSYWTAHKAVYESSVLAPMQALLDDLKGEFGEGRIFRPYRDVRFSADKSPYKTAIGATLVKGGYVQFSARGMASGTGYYHMAPDQLDRYRRAVADDLNGPRLERIVADLGKQELEVTAWDRLKSAPRGYTKDHPRVELLRNKELLTWREWPPAPWLETGEAAEHLAGFLRASRPLITWLDGNVGPSSAAPERR